MMTDQELLIPTQGGALTAAPSYATADENSSLLGDLGGDSFPRLTFKSNRFRVKKGESEDVLEVTKLPVILLSAYPKVSRIYYAHSYGGDDSTDGRPACASADGEVPLPTVATPQSDKCSTCPMNQKGSAISDDGGKRRACSYFKRAAIYLPGFPDYGPVAVDFKAMSLFGDSYADKGLLNLRAYADKLAQHKTKPEAVVTELSFDTNSSVPKILFRAQSYVDEALYREVIEPLIESGQPESMADTTAIRVEGADDDSNGAPAPSESGFRDKLMQDQTAPAHAQAPAKETKQEEQGEPEEPEVPDYDNAGVLWNPDHHATSGKTGRGILNADGTWRARKGGPVDDASPLVTRDSGAAKPAPQQEAKPAGESKPKFCGECGGKYGECEHTAPKAPPASDNGGETTQFDDDLTAALAEFGED